MQLSNGFAPSLMNPHSTERFSLAVGGNREACGLKSESRPQQSTNGDSRIGSKVLQNQSLASACDGSSLMF